MNHKLIAQLEEECSKLIPTRTKNTIKMALQEIEEQDKQINLLKVRVGEDRLQCFICRLKQHYKEAYTDGFYKTLENGINKITQDMESEKQ